MPNLNIYLLEGYSEEKRRVLLSRLTAVVADSLVAPLASIRLFLFELPRMNICVGGEVLDSPDMDATRLAGPTVQAFLVAGRQEAPKALLIEGMSNVFQEVLGIPLDPVRVMIVDVPNTDFGIAGKTAKALGR